VRLAVNASRPATRDIETIDSELRFAAALRCPARARRGPVPSIAVVNALLDERSELTEADALPCSVHQ
jgi:hypothetical protein